MKKIFALLCALAFTFPLMAQQGANDPTFNPDDDGFHIENRAHAIARQSDGKIIVAGYLFSSRYSLARLNADGSLDATFDPGTGPNDIVNAIAVQPDGKIIIGGTFTQYNGAAANRIARVNTNGSLDASFVTGTGFSVFGNAVYDILLQPDGKAVVAGSFSSYNGNSCSGILRLSTGGVFDNTFSSSGVNAGAFIYDIALQPDGKFLVGGSFTSYGGTARGRVARLAANGLLDGTFTPPGSGFNNTVFAVQYQPDGKVLAGGQFTTLNGSTANRLARLTTAGANDGTFVPGVGPNSTVLEMQLRADGKFYIGGHFTSVNGSARVRYTLVNANGTLDLTYPVSDFDAQISGFVLQPDNKLLVAGYFENYNGTPRTGLVRLNTDATLDNSFIAGVGFNRSVSALALQSDGKIIVGGYHTLLGNSVQGGLSRITVTGALDATFNAGGAGFVLNLGSSERIGNVHVQADDKIIVTGNFSAYNGTSATRLVRLNADGTLDASYVTGTGLNALVQSSALQADGKLLVSGNFTQYNGAAVSRLVRINTNGTLDASFAPVLNGPAMSIAVDPSGKIYVGGLFTQVNGSPVPYVARLNADGTTDASFNTGTGPNDAIYSMALQSTGKLVICGQFVTVNGTARTRLARLNTDGSLDGSFSPSLDVYASTVLNDNGDKIVLGGSFTTVNGSPLRYLARLNADGTTDADFNSGGAGPDNSVVALRTDGSGRLMIGGQFHTYNGTGRSHIARLLSTSISTGTVSGPICAAAAFDVPFTATGTFSAGNIFTAQLSDATGSFASPVSIGTLAGTASGTISATLPAATTAGTGYRIRVVASDPATTGTDNGIDLTTVSGSVNAVSNQIVCTGSTTMAVTFSGTASTYNWTNSDPTIGLSASGSGSIPVFTAQNSATVPVTATITVTPQTALSYAYVLNNGAGGMSVINTVTNTVVASVPISGSPWGITLSPDGSKLYVAQVTSDRVSVISAATHAVMATIPLTNSPNSVAVSPDGSRLYVTSLAGNVLYVINTATNTVTATIPVGSQPRGVTVSPNGSRVYVAVSGDDKVAVVDATANVVMANISVVSSPRGVVLSPSGNLLYTTAYSANRLAVINTSTNALVANIMVGSSPWGLAISPDGSRVYVANSGSNLVSVVNATTNTVASSITVGSSPYGVSITADGSRVYVANRSSTFASVINTATGTVIASPTIPVNSTSFGNFVGSSLLSCPGDPKTFTITVNPPATVDQPVDATACGGTAVNLPAFTGTAGLYTWTNSNTAIGLAASGSGNIPAFNAPNVSATATITVRPVGALGYAYVPNNNAGTVSVVNPVTGSLVTTITVGTTPRGVTVRPQGDFAYITNFGSNNVSVINTATNTVTATITVGTGPWGIAVSPDGSRLYVANNGSNNVSVINTATNAVITTIAAGTGPWGIAASPDGARVYVANLNSSNVSVINTVSNAVVATVAVGVSPVGVAVTPNSALVYVTNGGGNTVSVINAATNAMVTSVTVGTAPRGISINPDGTRAYVANLSSNTLSVINLVTNTVISSVPVGGLPYGVSVTPDASKVYVACGATSSLNVIDPATNTVTGTIAVGTNPIALGNYLGTLCAGSSRNFTVTVNLSPAATISYPGSPYCSSGTATPTLTGTAGGTYSAAPAGLSINATTGAIDVAASTSGTYTVTYTPPASGCAAVPATTPVTVSVPTVDQPADKSWCAGISGSLVSFTGSANSVFSWTNSNTATGLAASGTGNITSFTAANVASATTSTITITPKIFDATSGFAYVPNSGAATVTAVNLRTTGLTHIPVAAQPYGAVVNAAGTRVYVLHNTGTNLSLINTATNAVSTIAVGGPQVSGALTPDGSRLYFTKPGSNQVGVINTVTNTFIQNITVGTTPWDIKVAPDGTKVYVINQNSNNVSVINTATNTVATTLPFGNTCYSLALSPDGSRLFLGNLVGQTVSVINTATNALLFTIPNMGSNAAGMVVSPDGTRLFVALNGTGVGVFSTTTGALLATVSLPGAGPGICLNGDGSRVYVTNTTVTGGVYAFTSDSYTYLGLISTGTNPYGYGAWVYNPSCSGAPKSFTLTVNPAPTASFSYASSPYCNSGTATPTFSGSSGGTYSASPAGLSINASTGVVNIAASTTGTYTVTYSVTNGCGTASATAQITVITPTVSALPDVAVCYGTQAGPFNFTGSAASYSWTNSNTAIGLAASGNGNIAAFTGINAGTTPITGTITVTPSFTSNYAYVTNDQSGTVSVINTATGGLAATIPVGSNPTGVAIAPNGQRVYITNSGSSSVSIINTATNTVVGTVNVGSQPFAAAVSPDGTKVYVTNYGGNTVSVINTTTLAVTSITVGNQPCYVVFNAAGNRAYVSNLSSNTVSVINAATNTILLNIPVANGPFSSVLSPDGTKLYVVRSSTNQVAVISTATNTVSTNFSTFYSQPYGIDVAPDGSQLYVSCNALTQALVAINTTTGLLSQQALLSSPMGLQVSADGSKLYVTTGTPNLAVYNTSDFSTGTPLPTGMRPTAVGRFLLAGGTCAGTPETFDITINPQPLATIRYNGTPYCAGSGTATPVITGTTGGVFTAPAGLTINAATGVIDLGSSTPGFYLVDYALAAVNGCQETHAQFVVEILAVPTVDPTANVTACVGTATAPITFTGSATSYQWTNSNPAIGLAASGTGNIAGFNPTNAGASPITATVTVTPQHPGTGFAYIANYGASNLRVYNVATNALVTTIPTGGGPHSVTISPSGARVYTANQGGSSVSVINTATNTLVTNITGLNGPLQTAISPDGTRLYVPNFAGTTVSVINTLTNTIIASITAQNSPLGMVVLPGGTRGYVSNWNSGTVSVLNLTNNTLIQNIAVGGNPGEIVQSPDGSRIYVSCRANSRVYVINTTSNTVETFISVGSSPFGIAISQDGTRVYTANQTGNNVSVINTVTNTLINTIPVGLYPSAVSVTPDGGTLWVVNTNANTVSLVNLSTNAITSTLTGFATPFSIGSFLRATSTCSGTPQSFTITVNPVPSAAFSYSSASFCAAGTAVPTVTGTTGGVFSSTTGLAIDAATGTIDLATSTPGTYTVTYSLAGSCGTVSTTQTVVVSAVGTVNQPADVVACAGTTTGAVNFTGTASAFSWTNTNTSIGLAASGSGALPSFTATNATASPVTATISVTPSVTSGGKVYLPARDNNTVTVVDLATGTQTGVITGFLQPYGAVISPDRSKVYVSNGGMNSVSVVNTSLNTIVANINIGSPSTGLALSPDGSRLYVARSPNQVSVINTITHTIVTTITVGSSPFGVTLSANGSRLYVSNLTSDNVTVINTATNTVVTTIAVGDEPWNSALSPDGSRLYVTNTGGNSISVINTATNAVTGTITGVASPNAVVASSDGSKLFVMQPGTGIGVYSTVTLSQITTIPGGIGSAGICLSADGSRFYAPRYNPGDLLEFDANTYAPLRTIAGTGVGIYGFGNWMYNTSCTGSPKTFTITVNPQPAATIAYSAASLCATGTATPVITGTTGGTFSSTSGLSINPATGVVDLAASTAGTYTVTYSIAAANGCTAVNATTMITVVGTTSVNQPVDLTTCAGATAPGTTFSGGLAGTTYTWTNSNTAIGLAASGTGNIGSFTAANPTASSITATITVTPQNAPMQFAYVPNANNNTVRVYSINGNTAPATIAVGTSPLGVAVSPNGNYVYISNNGSNSVSVISTASQSVIATIPVGIAPAGIAVSPDGTRVYVANSGANTVSVINTATNTVSGFITLPSSGYGVAVSPDGTRLYVTRPGATALAVVNTATNAVIANVPVTANPQAVTVSPDGTKVYVANNGGGSVSVINALTNTMIVTFGGFTSPRALCLSADGSRLYVSNSGGSYDVSVVNTATSTIISNVNVGGDPYGLSLTPDGSRLFVVTESVGVMPIIFTSNNTLSATYYSIPGGSTGFGNFIAQVATVSCPGTPKSFTITVNPQPAATIAYNGSPFCTSGTATPTLTGTSGGSYSAPAGLSINAATGVIDLGASTAGTYTVTYTIAASGGCATVTATTSITINAAPTVTVPADVIACAGSTVAAIAFAGTANSFSWTNSNPAIGLSASGTGNIASFTAVNAGASPATATITVTPQSAGMRAYIPNESGASVSVINVSTGAVSGTIPVGNGPVSTLPSADGSRLYVSNYASGSVSVINTATNTVVATIPTGSNAYGLSLSPDGSRLYVSNKGAGNLSVVNTATNTVITNYAVPQSSANALSPDGTVLYATNATAGTLVRMNAATGAVTGTLATGAGAWNVVRSADGTRLYVSNSGANTVSIINAATFAVIANVPVGGFPVGLGLTPNGSRLYVSSIGGGPVSVINTATNALVASVGIGGATYGISVNPAGTEVYAMANGLNQVKVISTATNAVINSITVGAGPSGMGNVFVSSTTCAGAPQTFTITVNPAPSASISYAGSPFCATGTASPTLTGTTGGTYSAPAGLSIDATTGVINLAASTPGTYTVTYTIPAGNGCAAVNATASITVMGYASITQPANVVLCSGAASSAIAFTGSNGTGFSWTNSNPAIGLAASGTGNLPAFTAAVTGTSISATITVNMSAAPGFCAATSRTFTITVNPGNGVSFGYSSGTFCAIGTAAPIPQPGHSPGGTFTAGAGMVIDPVTGVIDLANTLPGYYTVVYDLPASGGCLAAQGSAGIQVNAPASATISYGAAAICASSAPVGVTRTGSGGGSYSATPAGLSIDALTGTITPATSTPGTYTVQYFVAGASQCPDFTTTVSVTITAAPAASIAYNGSPFCPGGTAAPTVTGTSGGTWSSTSGLVINAATGVIDLSASTPGTYTVSYSLAAGNGCAAATATTGVTITPVPTVATSADVVACAGSTVAAIPFSGTAASYSWTNSDASIGLPASGSGDIGSFTAINPGATPVTATITVTPQATASSGYAYIPNGGGASVTVVNPATGAVITTITVGDGPVSTVPSPDGSRMYVSNNSGNSVSVINTITNTVIATIPTQSQPSGMAISPDGSRLYVATRGGTGVAVINTATNAVIANYAVSNATAVALSPDGTVLYATSYNLGRVVRMNAATGAVTGTVATGSGPENMIRSADGTRLYVSNSQANTVSIINAASFAVMANVPVSNAPLGLGLTPDGSRLYVSNMIGGPISVINTTTLAVAATINASGSTYGISVNPDGSEVYAMVNDQNEVKVISTASNTIINSIAVGSGPSGLGNVFTAGVGCTGTPKTFTITVDPAPTATISYGGAPFCASGTASPTFTGTAGGTYSAPAGLSIDAATGIVNLATSTPGTYTVTYTIPAGGGCVAVNVTTTITISASPTVATPADVVACAGSTVPAIPFSGTAATYSWTNSNASIGLAASGTGTIGAFTAVNAGGAPVTATITVTPQLTPTTGYAYIPNEGSASVTVVDPATGAVVTTIAVGGGPVSTIPSPDGSRMYVSNNGGNSVSVINTTTNTVIATIPTQSQPYGMAISADGSRLYVATKAGAGVAVINTATNSVIANYPVPQPVAVALSPDGTVLYATDATNGRLVRMNAATGAVTGSLGTGLGAWSVIRSADGTRLYVSNTDANTVSIIDAASFTVLATLPAGGYPVGLGLTPDGSRLYVSNLIGGPILVINTATLAAATTIGAGGATYGISVNPLGTEVYATIYGQPLVKVISTASNTVTNTITVGNGPSGVGNVFASRAACTGTPQSFTITVNPAPAASISYAGSPFCATGTASPTLTGSGGGTWSAPGGLSIDAATGVINLAASAPGTYTVHYTIAAAGGCAAVDATASVTITAAPAATIAYDGSPYCSNAGIAAVTLTGTTGGVFSAPAGLSINATTGAVDLAASTAGSYTVTYTVAASGGCATFSTTAAITIGTAPAATISYTGSPYCAGGTATVTRTGTAGGSFSSTPGLVLNATTGDIDLAASTPGTYTVSYTLTAAGCAPVVATTSIIIATGPSATIAYAAPAFCAGSGVQPVTRTGSAGGSYSALPAGLSIDATTGAVDASASAPGSYTVTYAITASGPCAAFATTTTVTISALPAATISYAGSPYCSGTGTANPAITGTTGGTFTAPAGLVINATTGAIDLSASAPGTYTVSYTIAAAGGCSAVTTTAPVSVGRTPAATIAYPGSPYCATGGNASPALTGAAGGAFSGTPGLSINTATGVVNLAASTTGTHTVTYTVAGTGSCPAHSTTATLQINAAPTATIAYGAAAFCTSAPVQSVTLTGTGGGTFAATPAGLQVDATTGAITPGASAAGTYTVTYTVAAQNGCAAFSTTATVIITAQPAATIAYGGSPYCSNAGTANVTLTGTAGGSYSSTAGLVINAATGAIDLAASTPGTYTVTYTVAASGGCGALSTTATVTISQAPNAAISYSTLAFCSNSAPATANLVGVTGGVYSATPAGLAINGATGTIDPAASAPGTYTVSYTIAAAGGCAVFTTTAPVQITALPAATISYAAPLCTSGAALAATHTGTTGGVYSASPAGLSINAASGTINPATSTPGTYTVSYTMAAGGGCPAVVATTTVTVNAAPAATIAYAQPICSSGGTVAATLTGTTGGSFSATPAGLSIDAASGAVNGSLSTAGTYTVTYSIAPANGCALFTTTTTLVVNTAPSATISYAGSPFCGAGGTVAVTRTGTPGGSYSAGAGLVIDASTGAVDLGASTPGSYTVTYTVASANGCAVFTTTAAVVIRNPATVNAVANSSYCAGATTAPVNFVGTGTTYSWTNTTPAIGLAASGTGNIPAFTVQNTSGAALVATIVVTPDDNGCTGTPISFTITVNPTPVATLAAPLGTQLCPGTPLPLAATGGVRFEWIRNTNPLGGATTDVRYFTEAGTYAVRVVNNEGCAAMALNTITITEIPKPAPAFDFDATCLGNTTVFTNNTAANGNPVVNYLWNFDDGTTSTLTNPVHVFGRPGTFRVTLQASVPGCASVTATAVQNVRIVAPVPGVRLPAVNASAGMPQVLLARPLAGAAYTWQPAVGLNTANSPAPTATLNRETEYRIRMEFATGCVTVDTLLVRVFDKIDILVASAFTPNGDGRNDVLHAVPVGMRSLTYFRIFNRSGELVFESTNPANGWDGRIKGSFHGTATYVWVAEGIDKNGERVIRKGTVTLIL